MSWNKIKGNMFMCTLKNKIFFTILNKLVFITGIKSNYQFIIKKNKEEIEMYNERGGGGYK